MHIAFSGGKTLGHITPLLNIIDYFKSIGDEFTYIGLKGELEERKCEERGIPFVSIDVYPFYRKNPLKNIKTFYRIAVERRKLIKLLKQQNVTCVIVSGGFVAIPLVLAAAKLRIRILCLEQNTVMGLGNKLLSRYAYATLLTFPAMKHNKNMIVAGNPPIFKHRYFDHPIFKRAEKKVLIVAGSNGASFFIKLTKELATHDITDYVFLLVTSRNYKNDLITTNPNIYQIDYIPDLGNTLSMFDIIISRGGSSTLSEILSAKRKAIIIPSPNVTNNHQYHNAKLLSDMGLVYLVREKNAQPGIILSELSRINKDYKVNAALDSYHTKISNPHYYKIIQELVYEPRKKRK